MPRVLGGSAEGGRFRIGEIPLQGLGVMGAVPGAYLGVDDELGPGRVRRNDLTSLRFDKECLGIVHHRDCLPRPHHWHRLAVAFY